MQIRKHIDTYRRLSRELGEAIEHDHGRDVRVLGGRISDMFEEILAQTPRCADEALMLIGFLLEFVDRDDRESPVTVRSKARILEVARQLAGPSDPGDAARSER